MKNEGAFHALLLVAIVSALSGCANPAFKQLGSSVLSSTGMISQSEAEALFEAGGKLAKAASPLSEEEEYYLGRGVAATILSKYRPVKNQALLSYLNKVGALVAANSGRPEIFGGYHVMLLDTPEINAVSAPGGFIFLSKGLLGVLGSEDELAAVLAHEVGHIALGHGLGAISQANLTEAVTLLGKSAAQSYGGAEVSELTSLFGDSIKEVTDTVLKKGFSRSQEYDADLYSAAVLKKTGYNQGALLTVLTALQERETGTSGGWFDTHPPAERRISEVKGELSKDGTDGEIIRARRFLANVGGKS